ncbi:MAG: N-acetyl-D-Glu racemase DgcA [Steroidobacteraceae bacterium]
MKQATRRQLGVQVEAREFKQPFRITGHTFSVADIILVTLREGDVVGQGEACGVYYLNENSGTMRSQVEAVTEAMEQGADRQALLQLLPAGGARNALDCALWDLEAKLTGKSIWELTGIVPRETRTVLTVGIDTPAVMADQAAKLKTDRIKVKLSGDQPLERIRAVRAARPEASLIVDANQGWSFDQLLGLVPHFAELGIAMIEQPLPRGGDEALEGFKSPVPLCADESCLHTGEFEQAARRYDMINIKLDKTGGLTEALRLIEMAEARGIGLMVGNMMGTSLAMAPGYVVAQHCRFVDLDGPCFLKEDREPAMAYNNGLISAPSRALWG